MSRTKIRRRRRQLEIKRMPPDKLPRLLKVVGDAMKGDDVMVKTIHDDGCPCGAVQAPPERCTCGKIDVIVEPAPGGKLTAEWLRGAIFCDDDAVDPIVN